MALLQVKNHKNISQTSIHATGSSELFPMLQNYKTRDNAVFPEECTYQLFRIFCMLADMVENDQGLIEVRL